MDIATTLIGLLPVLVGAVAAARPRKRRLSDVQLLEQLMRATHKKALRDKLQSRIDQAVRAEVVEYSSTGSWWTTFRIVAQWLTIASGLGSLVTFAGLAYLTEHMQATAMPLAVVYAGASIIGVVAWWLLARGENREEKRAQDALDIAIEKGGDVE